MKKLGLFLLFPSFYIYALFLVTIVIMIAVPNSVTNTPRMVMVVAVARVSGTSTSCIFSNTAFVSPFSVIVTFCSMTLA